MRKTSFLIIVVLAVSSITFVLSPVATDVGIPSLFPSTSPGPALITFRNLTTPLLAWPGEVGAWESQTIYASSSSFSGYLTVGGNGYLLDSFDMLATPNVSPSGFLNGAAWGDNEFLLVGSHYGPSNGVIMYTYNPITNTLTNLTSIFQGALASNAALASAQWNGHLFYVLGVANIHFAWQARLYVLNPKTNSFTNITSTLPPSFLSLAPGEQQIVWTPMGLFILLQTTGGLRFGVVRDGSFKDLSSSIPSGLIITNCNGTLCLPGGNLMQWDQSTSLLFIAGQLLNHHIALFSYNSATNKMQNLSSYFAAFDATIDTTASINGQLYLGGGPGVGIAPPPYTPFLAAMNVKTLAITDLSSLIPSSFGAVSTVATDGTSVFLGGGVLYFSQYGILAP